MASRYLHLYKLYFVAVLCSRGASASMHVGVGSQGSVTLSVDGDVWLISNKTYIDSYPLIFSNSSKATGTDTLGAFTANTFIWKSNANVVMEAEVRTYDDDFVVFEQRFPTALSFENQLSKARALITDFPSFEEQKSGLSFATFNGGFAKEVAMGKGAGLASCSVGTQGGVPIILFDADSSPTKTLVASQLTSFKGGDLYCSGHLSMGVKGTSTSIPAEYSVSFVVVEGDGIAKTMEKWGDILLKKSGKLHRASPYHDDIVSYVGWWTDNGAYYHYPGGTIEGDKGGYQKAMHAVADYHRQIGAPFKHWQLDSWFVNLKLSKNPFYCIDTTVF